MQVKLTPYTFLSVQPAITQPLHMGEGSGINSEICVGVRRTLAD